MSSKLSSGWVIRLMVGQKKASFSAGLTDKIKTD
jgi:hypothetical protein